MALIFSDTFTDTDATSLDAHVPDLRPGSVMWVERAGDWQIANNRAVVAVAANSSHATVDSGESDMLTLTAVVCVGSSTNSSIARDTGIVLRYSTGMNFILCSINAAADVVRITRWTSGVPTVLNSASIDIDGAPAYYTLTVTISGNDITASVGAATASATDSQNSTSTLHGIYLRDTTSYVDDFQIATNPGTFNLTAADIDTGAPTITAPSLIDAPTVFIDGYGGDVNTAQDMLMSQNWPTYNGGGHNNFQLKETQHALMRFNLSSIPAGATCVSAKLHLFHSYDPEGATISTGKIYSVSAANSSWIPGTKSITLASAGEPTWNALEADGSGGVQTPWAGSAGCNTPGTDYETPVLGAWEMDPNSAIGTEYVIDLDTTRITDWAGASNTNYGLILLGDNGSIHVAQSDHPIAAYRPVLVTVWDIPVEDITGAGDITLDALVVSGVGEIAVHAQGQITLDALTASGVGVVQIAGQGSITLNALTVSGSGVIGSVPITGQAFVTLGAVQCAGAGGALIQGQAAVAMDLLTALGGGVVGVIGQAVLSVDSLMIPGAGAVLVTGAGIIVPDVLMLTAEGGEPLPVAPTPGERVFTISIDQRVYQIIAEARVSVITFERRAYKVR